MSSRWLRLKRWLVLGLGVCLVAGLAGCRARVKTSKVVATARVAHGPVRVNPIDLPKAEYQPGTAVVLLVDTSGSMAQEVNDRDGRRRPKHQIAREAVERIID